MRVSVGKRWLLRERKQEEMAKTSTRKKSSPPKPSVSLPGKGGMNKQRGKKPTYV